MENNISYLGLTRNGSDFTCKDGELAESVNLLPNLGAIEVVPKLKDTGINVSGRVLFIHKADSDNYFYITDTQLRAVKITSTSSTSCNFFLSLSTCGAINSINCIGNTIIICGEKGIFYALYQNGDYLSLGQKPPFTSINFGLKYYNAKSYGTIQMSDKLESNGNIKSEYITEVTNAITGCINKLLQEEVRDKNRFTYPFLLRYAYRMYDGSLFMHSAPILMLPSSYRSICTIWNNFGNPEIVPSSFNISLNATELHYTINKISSLITSETSDLLLWKDIISRIDIFISEPFFTYDQNGKIEKLYCSPEDRTEYLNDRCAAFFTEENSTTPKSYTKTNWSIIGTNPNGIASIPMRKKAEVVKDIQECGIFYKISSIPIEDIMIQPEFRRVSIEEKTINTLQVQERMSDDYLSHNIIIAKKSYGYNSRINLINIETVPFKGFDAKSLFSIYDNIIKEESSVKIKTIKVYIKDTGGDIKIENIGECQYGIGPYLFYPNSKAYKMLIEYETSLTAEIPLITYLTVKLKEHPSLNGAYSFLDFDLHDSISELGGNTSTNTKISSPNKIYTSEVNNPFVFKPEGINTIGSGSIIGLSSTTKALSQGQFGQFPLYAFTSDGIWALEVNSIGTYSSKQIISRDVINNANSITQIDGAIIFTTDKGLMLIQGSELICLSEVLDGKTFSPKTLEYLSANELGFESMIDVISDNSSFVEYLKTASIAYDYVNSRLLIINPNKRYQYMYSFLSKSFTKIYHGIEYKSVINNFPNSFVQDNAFKIYNFSNILDRTSKEREKALLISRAIKFNSMGLKTIFRLLNRGMWDKRNSYIKTALYGSSDGEKYFRITTLRGKSWSFFRIVLYVNCTLSETLSGTSFDIENRYTNKIR